MTQNHPPNRRSVLIINPRFQYRFLAWISAAAIVIAIVFFISHKVFFYSFFNKGIEAGLPEDHIFFIFLRQQEALLGRIFLMTALVVGASATFFAIRLSNRIAGPLYRLHKHMMDVAAGETTDPVSFRDEDYFMELATAYNAQLKKLTEEQK